ncbi:DUF1801 domain-containing protein [Nitratireductor sp. XY-223]|uniref:DUF1801 domain-containing protein n=1 Tax=Nitratireductor sp. XY-223 TaxID=2561926 RepID=UPI0010AA44A2|nr:DUF1801 domain-containing protein [Nitratireductor sp. XY-223]
MTPFQSSDVEAVFSGYPEPVRSSMLALRELVFEAAQTDGVGEIEETLKWGEPSYLTHRPKSGSTVRIDWKPDRPEQCSIFFHCQTSLIANCSELYPDLFEFEGNRRMSFAAAHPPPAEAIRHCLALALTYHRRKKSAAAPA